MRAHKSETDSNLMGITFPNHALMDCSVSFRHSNVLPIRITEGRLVFVTTKSEKHRVIDVVFRLSPGVPYEAIGSLYDFASKLNSVLRKVYRHVGVCILPSSPTTYVVCRIFQDKDFKCREHPELLICKHTELYRCPLCRKLVITGMPHT